VRRIAVIGRAGSGKTTTALALGQGLALPVTHLDQLYWSADWNPAGSSTFDQRLAAQIAEPRWILDGSYLSSSLGARLRRADLVVLTSAPLWICIWRVIARTVRYRGRPRGDRPVGADEAFSLTFLVWMLRWTLRHRDLAGEVLRIAPDVPIAAVRGEHDLEALLARLPQAPRASD
jgi:adenylate kinase family enzyme